MFRVAQPAPKNAKEQPSHCVKRRAALFLCAVEKRTNRLDVIRLALARFLQDDEMRAGPKIHVSLWCYNEHPEFLRVIPLCFKEEWRCCSRRLR